MAIDRFDYTYDFASNRLTRNSRVDLVAGATLDERDQAYGYDGLHRIESSDEPIAANDRHWSLDQLGNWDELHHNATGDGIPAQTRTHNAANETTSISNLFTPRHDEAGNMTQIPVSSGNYHAATYDAWNRLASVRLDGFLPPGSGPSPVHQFEYDGLHRRTTRTEAGVAKHFYYNERWQVLTETDASGTAQAIYSYFPHYVDAVAVRMTPTSDHFYLCDALASVTAVVDNETDAVVERYAYSPYGRITVLDADYAVDEDNLSDIGNEHLFTGRRTDPGTGLQINRFRYYHAGLGRWGNRDPIGYTAGDNNLYGYVGAMPTHYYDPAGLQVYGLGGGPYSQGNTIAQNQMGRYPGISEKYCDAAKKYSDNKWLQCACDVSNQIGQGMGVLWWHASYSSVAVEKRAWFNCTRKCLQKRWEDGIDNQETGDPLEEGSEWDEWCEKCDLNDGSVECCEEQVEAEQTELQNCMSTCGNWKWGHSFPVNWSGWPKQESFNDLAERIQFGNEKCCSGK